MRGKQEEKRKIIYRAGECDIEIDFMLMEKKNKKYVGVVKVIPRKLPHKLVAIDLNKEVLKK